MQARKAVRNALRTTMMSGTMLGAVAVYASAAGAQDIQLPPSTQAVPPAVVAAPPIEGEPETLQLKPLQVPNTSLRDMKLPEDATAGRLPEPIPLPFGPDRDSGWTYSSKVWVPPVFCHQPTYYEDMMLENHGHERFPALQPMVSGARFYSGLIFTPYLACLNGPFDDVASAGRYRPGSIAPTLRQRAPYDLHALGTQAAAVGTGVMLINP
jgi:hypothetical protein